MKSPSPAAPGAGEEERKLAFVTSGKRRCAMIKSASYSSCRAKPHARDAMRCLRPGGACCGSGFTPAGAATVPTTPEPNPKATRDSTCRARRQGVTCGDCREHQAPCRPTPISRAPRPVAKSRAAPSSSMPASRSATARRVVRRLSGGQAGPAQGARRAAPAGPRSALATARARPVAAARVACPGAAWARTSSAPCQGTGVCAGASEPVSRTGACAACAACGARLA